MKRYLLVIFVIVSAMTYAYKPVDVWFGPKAADDPTGNYYNLIRFLDSAEESIYCSFHELDIIAVAKHLVKRKQEGVYVEVLLEKRWLADSDNRAALSILQKGGVKYIPDHKNSGLMHNKYIVVDKKRVWSGSANLTEHGFFYNYNDSVWIESEEVALCFLEDYFTISNPKAMGKKGLFKSYDFMAGDVPIEVYFSPTDNPTRYLTDHIREAKSELRFVVFAYSSRPIVNAMLDREKNGVTIYGIFDNSFSSPTMLKTWNCVPYYELRARERANVKYDNLDAKIHHKQIILDDNVVLTGSFNFSGNAEKNNNENLIVIHSEEIAKKYIERYNEMWEEFPQYTLYDQYEMIYKKVQAKRTNEKVESFWQAFNERHYKKQIAAIKQHTTNGVIKGVMRDTLSGDSIGVRIKGVEDLLYVKLAGVASPVMGHHGEGTQNPQATIAHQFASLTANNKPVEVTIIEEITPYEYVGLVRYTKIEQTAVTNIIPKDGEVETITVETIETNDDGGVVTNTQEKTRPLYDEVVVETYTTNVASRTLNEEVLRQGWGYFAPVAKTNKAYAVLRKAYLYARSRGVGLWSKEYKLATPPWVFAKQERLKKLAKAAKENKYSIIAYEPGVVIGNRDSKKFYLQDSTQYWKSLNTLKREKIIYFATQEDAERAGYIQGKN